MDGLCGPGVEPDQNRGSGLHSVCLLDLLYCLCGRRARGTGLASVSSAGINPGRPSHADCLVNYIYALMNWQSNPALVVLCLGAVSGGCWLELALATCYLLPSALEVGRHAVRGTRSVGPGLRGRHLVFFLCWDLRRNGKAISGLKPKAKLGC
jgi:hypothetical protein